LAGFAVVRPGRLEALGTDLYARTELLFAERNMVGVVAAELDGLVLARSTTTPDELSQQTPHLISLAWMRNW
jgi:hypothetical protein